MQPDPVPVAPCRRAPVRCEIDRLALSAVCVQGAVHHQAIQPVELHGYTRVDGQGRTINHGHITGHDIRTIRSGPCGVNIDGAAYIR